MILSFSAGAVLVRTDRRSSLAATAASLFFLLASFFLSIMGTSCSLGDAKIAYLSELKNSFINSTIA